MIKVSNVTKKFDHFTAVRDLSFTVRPGEVLGFLGPNGAGKSTTMKMITGFLSPSSGTIEVCGHNIEQAPLAAKQLIGYLPEGAPCYGAMTVLEFLQFIAELRGFKGHAVQPKVDEVVSALELDGVLHRSVDKLSKGFKRRVGLAQAIIHNPMVLILDEPTDGLDPNQKHQVRNLIRNLSKDKIVIISTHILEEVTAVCSRAMIISDGQRLVDGTPSELESQSRFHGAVTLELDMSSDKGVNDQHFVVKTLSEIQGVVDVESLDPDGYRFTVFPKHGEDVYPQILEVVNKHSWQLKELFVEKGRLDEVFRTVTSRRVGA